MRYHPGMRVLALFFVLWAGSAHGASSTDKLDDDLTSARQAIESDPANPEYLRRFTLIQKEKHDAQLKPLSTAAPASSPPEPVSMGYPWRNVRWFFLMLILVGAPVAGSILAAVPYIRKREVQSALLAGIRALQKADPPAALEGLAQYLKLGGDPARLKAKELGDIFTASAASGALLAELPGLSSEQRLAIARRFSEDGRHTDAMRVLTPRLLRGLARSEKGCAAVAAIVQKANMTEIFAADLARNAPELARFFSRAGPPAPAHRGDFREHVTEGRFAEAKALLEKAEQDLPIKSDPGLYYDFGLLAEKSGDGALAAAIYKKFIVADVLHADVFERYGRLKGRLATKPREEWLPEDFIRNFKEHVEKKRCSEAKVLFERVELLLPVKNDPGLFYDFAVLAEASGDLALAAAIYKKFIVADLLHRDVFERYGRLKGR